MLLVTKAAHLEDARDITTPSELMGSEQHDETESESESEPQNYIYTIYALCTLIKYTGKC